MTRKLICLVICILFLFTACSKKEVTPPEDPAPEESETPPPEDPEAALYNSAAKALSGEAYDRTALAILLNQPSSQQLSQVENLEKLDYDQSGESVLILPVKNGTDLRIEQVEYLEGSFNTQEVIAAKLNSQDQYGMLLTAVRPEGIPALRIIVTCGSETGSYLLSYNGKDGQPDLEKIMPGDTDGETVTGSFGVSETETVLGMRESALKAVYGEPDQVVEVEPVGSLPAKQLHYASSTFDLIYPEDSEGIVYHAEIGDNLMSLLRGIQIGDPLDTVLAAFPDEGTGAVETLEEGVIGRLLYGQYGYMEVYGAVLYDGETPISVRFADQDAVVEFHLADGAVTGVTYLLQTI